ncbi:hypothetical protein P154DRAFT_521418 [Amniculicola lignicola CBS 123094]|uniref:DnaJ homologue subfamily C member 28 conserved domain-containing protein n=1 Tax=Amniculicola lignicola CBS 123094 TaxID=1392246 RepID=A0A6A5WJ99_9PLEO|nr:hypothetical protein P154DRAFT_521418 [Amniculicola lignicola CBS 123094]
MQDGKKEEQEGAMSRRLRDMSEEALQTGGRSAQKAVEDAGFSEDLKRQLEERISSATFRAEHRSAFTEAELGSHVGRGSRDVATAAAWTGEESVHDTSLRMLTDLHKPLRGGRTPLPTVQMPKSIDTGRSRGKEKGVRLVNARDRSGLYSSLKEADLDQQEKEKRFQELKDRFSPHARAVVPGTVQGLASLANERIEDAIARGQFKNLPRGMKIERDYNASSPFLDTTEYFMNKIIKKQDIVPPWIEKQQELVRTAMKFRSRLRNDWKRHAARMIASSGGTLLDQMRRAEAYAKAELLINPPKKKEEAINAVDESGHLSQISLSGELKIPSPSSEATISEEITVERTTLNSKAAPTPPPSESPGSAEQTISIPIHELPSTVPPAPHPFRDPAWERIEHSYQTLAIEELNSKTRSYNLQAPDLAKKPYFNLQRELNACFADVAPELADTIKQRATRPAKKVEGFGTSMAGDGAIDRLVGERVRVHDERPERKYGFRQLWKDVWGG